MQKISVTIITKNSQNLIKKCINSVSWADEIIVVDEFSTDKTCKIAMSAGAKIYSHKWEGYARQKNYAISKAKNKWILSIDSDEMVDTELKKNILIADFSNFDGFYIARKNFIGSKWIKYSGFYPDWQLRLFKSDLRFSITPVHEQVKAKKSSYISGHIKHLTYKDYNDYLKKIKKYSLLDAQVLFNKKRKYNLTYQYLKPVKEFIERYFFKKGFMDGNAGFVIAIYSAYSKYLAAKYLKKIYENRN